MKRLGSSDSLGALMSMCPPEEHSPRSNHIYSREYQSMLDGLDEEGCVEEGGHIPEKKRRLSVDQVKALERNFEVENKLEPERKVKLAQELGLQPRQVAVWFQNRRARWKTKQLERDYGVLKANFDSLKQNYESLQHDKDALLKEIKELKSKLKEENTDQCNLHIKEEAFGSESDNNEEKTIEKPMIIPAGNSLMGGSEDANASPAAVLFTDQFKDGQSDSDSSAILNDENSPNASNSSSGVLQNHHYHHHQQQQQQQQMLMSPPNSSSLSSINCFSSFSESLKSNNVYQPQFVKMEEHNFFGGEEACNFFSEEQAPTLPWYCSPPDQWTWNDK